MLWRKGDKTGPKSSATAEGKTIHRGNYMAKLNWQIVREIRESYAQGATQGELCRRFKVTIGTVGRVVRNEAWIDRTETSRRINVPQKSMEEILESARQVQAEVNASKPPSQPASLPPDKPPMSLEELMKRESERSDPAGERAMERLSGEADKQDGGLGELLGPVMPE
jgi:hypothetical protein